MILQVASENGKGLGRWEIGDLEFSGCKLQNPKLDWQIPHPALRATFSRREKDNV
jgi:hypothetical protein